VSTSLAVSGPAPGVMEAALCSIEDFVGRLAAEAGGPSPHASVTPSPPSAWRESCAPSPPTSAAPPRGAGAGGRRGAARSEGRRRPGRWRRNCRVPRAPLRKMVWERASLAASVVEVTVDALRAEAALQQDEAPPPSPRCRGHGLVNEWGQWPSWRRLVAIARAPVGRSAAAAGALAASSLAELVEGLEEYAPMPIRLPSARSPSSCSITAPRWLRWCRCQHRLPEPGVGALRPRRRAAAGGASHGRLGGAPGPGGRRTDRGGRHRADHGGSGSVQALLMHAAEVREFFVSCVATLPRARASSWRPTSPPAGCGSR